ncbi:hypothetical protein J3U11_05530 [Gilliamella sp. B2840]|uniref:hypothetical protein n=1 Tax=Gilliamella sp. B2840 TaxID=2817975 RepID=UPI00226A3AEF|nr:hypothetical protein [Gilliamella sp. B2840]MCX8700533.1 hypothetical protein [Gilliamella sp. B2840]
MFAIIGIAVSIIAAISGVLLAARVKASNKMTADDINTGTSKESTEIPVVFGTVKVNKLIYVWYGNQSTVRIE